MAAGNTTTAVTAGSGVSIAAYQDANSYIFQRVISAPEASQKATFSATYTAQSAGTSATTNIFTIAGSASKTIKITRLDIAGTSTTTAAYFDIILRKQSAADSGGTAATTATVVPHDSADTATAAAPIFYTAGPTAGTLVGNLATFKYFAPVTGTAAPVTTASLVGAPGRIAKPIVLRGTSQVLAVTLNGVTPGTAQSWDVFVEWIEETE